MAAHALPALLPVPARIPQVNRILVPTDFSEASTAQGNIGVQVWVNQGMYGQETTDGADAQAGEAPKKPKRTYKR